MGVAAKHRKNTAFKSEIKLPRRPHIPKAEHPAIFARPGQGLGLREPLKAATKVSGPEGKQPTSGPLALATKPEWYVYWALERLGYRPYVDFTYRGEVAFTSSLALSTQLDFQILDGSQIAFEIQGLHWHYELGAQKQAEDQLRQALLVSAGWTVVLIDEDDAVRDPLFYVKEALAGRSHSFATTGYFVQPWA